MAYLKYKELTKYFYFYKEIEIETLPKYVTDYVNKEEKIVKAYMTAKDRSIFTTHKMVLFDISRFTNKKIIYTISYKNISTLSVEFHNTTASLLLYVNSGYPVNIKFINMSADEKVELRKLYTYISDKVVGFKEK